MAEPLQPPPQPAPRPLSFREVEDMYKHVTAKDPSLAGLSLRDFSQLANEAMGGETFLAGDVGPLGYGVKKASSLVDTALSPVSDLTEEAGRFVGGLVSEGGEELGGAIGESLPRGVLETLGYLVPASKIPKVLALLSTAADAYTDTGSAAAGGVQAATLGLLPGMAKAGANLATRVSQPVGEVVERNLGSGIAGLVERGIEYGGVQGAGLLNDELNIQGQSVVMGEGLRGFDSDHVAQLAAGSLAFAPFDAPMLVRGYRGGANGPEPFNLRTAFSGEASIGRSLADFNRQQAATKDIIAQVTEHEKGEQRTVELDPPEGKTTLKDNLEAVETTKPKPPKDPVKASEEQGKRIDAIPDPGIQEALKKFKERMETVPESQEQVRRVTRKERGEEEVPVQENLLLEQGEKPTAKVPATKPGKKDIPLTINSKMRKELKARGYDSVQISKMSPAEAVEIIEGTEASAGAESGGDGLAALLTAGDSIPAIPPPKKVEEPKRIAPATFKGIQPGIPGKIPDQELWNLTEQVGEKPAGSTVTRQTLEDAGFEVPAVEGPVVTKKELVPALEKVDEVSGGNVAQVARAAETLAEMPLPKDAVGTKELDVELAKRVALARVEQGKVIGENPANTLYESTEQFFSSLFKLRGYSDAENVRLTNIALKIATGADATGNRARVVVNPDDGSNFFGFSPNNDLRDALVSLSRRNTVGLSKEVENALSFYTFGHEVFHSVTANAFARAAVNPDDRLAAATSRIVEAAMKNLPEENIQVTSLLFKSVIPTSEMGEEVVEEYLKQRLQVYRGHGQGGGVASANEVVSDWAGLLGMGIASPSKVKVKKLADALTFGPDRLREFSDALYTDMLGLTDAVAARVKAMDPKRKPQVEENIQTALDNIKDVIAYNSTSDNAVGALKEVLTRSIPRVFEKDLPLVSRDLYRKLVRGKGEEAEVQELNLGEVFKTAGEFLTKNGIERRYGVRPGFLDNFIPMAQRAKSHPEIRPTVDLAFSFAAIASKMSEKMLKPFTKPDGKLDQEFVVKMMNPTEKVNGALNKLTLLMNEKEGWFSEAEFAEITKGLTEVDRKFVSDAIKRVSQANMIAAVERVRGFETQIKNMMATIVMQSAHKFPAGVKVNEKVADAYAEVVYGTVVDGTSTPFDMTGLPAEVHKRLINYAGSMKPVLKTFKDHLLGEGHKGKPWWTSEVRLGNWYLSWKDEKGNPFVIAYEKQSDAVARGKAEEAKGRKVQYWNKHDRFEAFRDLSPDLVQRYAAADKALFERALNSVEGLTPEMKKDLEELYTPGAGASELITPPSLQRRELVGGREELNMMAGVLHYLESSSMSLAKRYVKGRVPLALHTPEMRLESNRALQNEMRTYLNDIINMPGKELHALKNLVFFNYLAGNLSATLVEPTQMFVAQVPYLIREGAEVGEAYKLAFRALREAPAYAWGKGPKNVKDIQKHRNIIRAVNEGVINKGWLQEVSQFEDSNMASLLSLANGGSVVKAQQLVKNKMYWLFNTMRNVYAVATQLNSAAAFISAYDYSLAKTKLKNSDEAHEEAYVFARTATQTTMLGGGRAARPLGIAKFGRAQGIASAAYSLQSYTFGMMSMIARLGREMIDRGVPEVERKAARKAFGVMMGTQFALGGALGLPMTAAIVAVIDQFYPEAELSKKIRQGATGVGEMLAGLVTDDEEMGHVVGTGLLNGVANSIGPIDFGSRFQLGAAFGLNTFEGFSFQNLFGPAANMLANYVKGTSAALSGDFQEFSRNIAPASVRGLLELIHNDFVARDRQGNLLFEPTAAEIMATAIGFKPRRYNEHYSQLRILRQTEEVTSKAQQRFHEDLALLLEQGNTDEVRRLLLERSMTVPGYDARNGVRRVVEILQNRTVPVDIYRRGRAVTADAYAETARAFGASRPQITERELFLQRKALERSIGLPGVGMISPSEVGRVSMIDQLLAENPNLTVRQARMMVEQMGRRF